jgi:hypothetical protein
LLLKAKPTLVSEKEYFLSAQTSFVDVSKKLQILCDQAGNCVTHLFIDKNKFDPNEYFGIIPQSKEIKKIFECHLDCQGFYSSLAV